MIENSINNTVEMLKELMPNVGDQYDKRDYCTDENLKKLKEYGFESERYDFGIEMVLFTRIK